MSNLKKNDGITFLMVIILLVVVGTMSAALLTMYMTNVKRSSDNAEKTKAFYAAEAGINIVDQFIKEFNEKEGSLGIHLPKHYDDRFEKLLYGDEKDNESVGLNKFIEELNKKLEISNYYLNLEIDEVNTKDYSFKVIVKADSEKSDTSKFNPIKSDYILATSDFGGFFAHTLAARSIKVEGDVQKTLENILFNVGWWKESGSGFLKRTTYRERELNIKSDLIEEIPRIATGEGLNSVLGNLNFAIEQERDKSYLWESVPEWETIKSISSSDLTNIIEFYGESDTDLYLPESDTDDFTNYVRGVNFREVLKQNGMDTFNGQRLDTLSPININPDNYEPNEDFDELPLSELKGYYKNMKDLRDSSKNYSEDNGPGPYIYVDEFEFEDDDFDGGREDDINFSHFSTVNNVVQLYIDKSIDFSGNNTNITFDSENKKSIIVQSGGNEISLTKGNRITYLSNSGIEGMAYYAPNATLKLSGDFTGPNISGWGHSFNVNKIILNEGVTFPTFNYDPEESSFLGNIHADIVSYLDYDKHRGQTAGDFYRTNWRIDK